MNRLTRLRDLVIDRVSLVPAGDDPEARIVLWKARRPTGGSVTTTVENALDALAKQRERTEAVNAETISRADAVLAKMRGGGGSVTKAADAAAQLRRLVEKSLDRQPLDRRGDPRTVEMALADVTGTREGRRLTRAIDEEGALGKEAFAKAFDEDVPEASVSTPTRAESKLDEMARSVAKARGITREQAMAKVIESPEGRAAYAEHCAEVALRG